MEVNFGYLLILATVIYQVKPGKELFIYRICLGFKFVIKSNHFI